MTTRAPADEYTCIADAILATLKAGTDEWRLPWRLSRCSVDHPVNVTTGNSYRGVNKFVLRTVARARGFTTGLWGTWRHWQEHGAQVCRGERATTIVAGKRNGPGFAGRGNAVFNRHQVDGYDPFGSLTLLRSARIPHADAFLAALGFETIFEGQRAFYCTGIDFIFMPPFRLFREPIGFIGAYLHEAAHASGAECRLNRDLGPQQSIEAHAFEEIIAELTASFLLFDLGLADHPRSDHAAYVGYWLTFLNNDRAAFYRAAEEARRAADYLHALQSSKRRYRYRVSWETAA